MRSAEPARRCKISSWRHLTYDDLGQLIADSPALRDQARDPARATGAREDRRQSIFCHSVSLCARGRSAAGLRSRRCAMVLGPRSHPRQALHRQRGRSHGRKLNRLPAETQAALRQLACVGVRASSPCWNSLRDIAGRSSRQPLGGRSSRARAPLGELLCVPA